MNEKIITESQTVYIPEGSRVVYEATLKEGYLPSVKRSGEFIVKEENETITSNGFVPNILTDKFTVSSQSSKSQANITLIYSNINTNASYGFLKLKSSNPDSKLTYDWLGNIQSPSNQMMTISIQNPVADEHIEMYANIDNTDYLLFKGIITDLGELSYELIFTFINNTEWLNSNF